MELTVKTLKGEKFSVTAEESNTIEEVKGLIEQIRSDLPAASMKLIYTGKVLKDTQTIAECELKPNAFLVVMITKAKKAPTAAAAPAEADTKPEAAVATPAASSSSTTDAPVPSNPSNNEPSSAAAPTATAAPTTASDVAAPVADDLPTEAVSQLMAMGFPEAEVRACLRAAGGNPDVAVEFLMNGIPDYAQQQESSSTAPAPSQPAASSSSSEPLSQLRNHPQINQLRTLVQQNPSTLQAVLTQIGQQQPGLLQEINSNQELFLQIMNEPVVEEESSHSGSNVQPRNLSSSIANANAPTGGDTSDSRMEEIMGGLGNPAQMMQLIETMSPEELQSMAAMMGLTPEQLRSTAQAIGMMPPDELQNYMNMAMQAQGGMPPEGAGAGQVLRLSEEEMAAVDRLASMGFDRTEAAQAYIACDKNEELAANLLMDGGFGFGGNDDPMDGNDEDMYD
jgi:UV excision repair protein RAD23